eukprot:TRINITY_DN6097_c0_g1_i1.p4 TRINITY_DN6097_c0_g1~~TRINITY_DN6097_c0_g1_i1.p4  ORF type:complete len:257 (-),score=38.21 TRINITY_DN6097_c0_g1_i1:283-1053(-)
MGGRALPATPAADGWPLNPSFASGWLAAQQPQHPQQHPQQPPHPQQPQPQHQAHQAYAGMPHFATTTSPWRVWRSLWGWQRQYWRRVRPTPRRHAPGVPAHLSDFPLSLPLRSGAAPIAPGRQLSAPPLKKYLCTECNKRFSKNYNLSAHKRLHTGERPFVCSYPGCTRSFLWKSSLTSHRAVHARNQDAPPPAPGAESGGAATPSRAQRRGGGDDRGGERHAPRGGVATRGQREGGMASATPPEPGATRRYGVAG